MNDKEQGFDYLDKEVAVDSIKGIEVFVLKGSKNCIAIDAIPSKECREYHENSYIQINGKQVKCGHKETKEEDKK